MAEGFSKFGQAYREIRKENSKAPRNLCRNSFSVAVVKNQQGKKAADVRAQSVLSNHTRPLVLSLTNQSLQCVGTPANRVRVDRLFENVGGRGSSK